MTIYASIPTCHPLYEDLIPDGKGDKAQRAREFLAKAYSPKWTSELHAMLQDYLDNHWSIDQAFKYTKMWIEAKGIDPDSSYTQTLRWTGLG